MRSHGDGTVKAVEGIEKGKQNMDERSARAMLPVWADGDDCVKEYNPKHRSGDEKYGKGRFTEERDKAVRNSKSRWEELRHTAMSAYYVLLRRYLIAFVLLAAFLVEGVVVSAVTERRVSREVRQTVESEMRNGFALYLEQQEEKQRAESFLTGDASREAAIADLADCFDELIATYAMDYNVNEQGLNTLGWVFIARVIKASSEFGRSPQEIILKSGAWEGQVVGHAVRNQDTQIALQIARDYLNGNYPDDFTPDMTFGDREKNGGFVARNEFITGPNTVYWRYKG